MDRDIMYTSLTDELGAYCADMIIRHCGEDVANKIAESINYKNSDLTFKLPIKPFSFVWVMNTCKYLDISINSEIPENCQGIFTEACETCKYRNKECKDGAFAEEKWFYLDSPILSLVINEWGKTVFASEEECVAACKEKFDSDIVDNLMEQYHNYKNSLSNIE